MSAKVFVIDDGVDEGCFKEAAEHLLGALSMHKLDSSMNDQQKNVSNTLWDTLRRAFLMMQRQDLAELAGTGSNVDQFRREFDF